MKYIYKIAIVFITVLYPTLHSAPSVRSKSRTQSQQEKVQVSPRTPQQKSVPKPSVSQKNIVSQPLPTPVEKKTTIDKEPTLPEKELSTLDEETTATLQENNSINTIKLHQEKLIASSLLTTEITNYFFNTALETIEHEKNKGALNKKLRTIFNGLRYPIYRHLRESVSSYNDSNSFFNGFIEGTIAVSQAPSSDKEKFIKNINSLAQTLKQFKLYHIDQGLSADIEKQLELLQEKCNELKSSSQSDPLLQNMSTGIVVSLNNSYENNLADINRNLNNDEIKTYLPAREGSIKYGYRAGRKSAISTTMYLYKNVRNYLQSFAFGTIRKAITSPVQTVKNLFMTEAQKEHLRQQQADVYYAKEPQQSSQNIASQSLLKDILNTPGAIYNYFKKADIKTVAQDFLQVSSNRAVITATNLTNVMWPHFVADTIMPLMQKSTIVALESYFYSLPELVRKELVASNATKLAKIASLNFSFMKSSANFIVNYVQELVDNLSSKVITSSKEGAQNNQDLSIEIITKALQSAQIEIFRHRRSILSEISNPKAFTGNYFAYLHALYILQHNNKNTMTEDGKPKEKAIKFVHGPSVVESLTSTLMMSDDEEESGPETYFEVVDNSNPILQRLKSRVSTDPQNAADLILLKGALSKDDIKQLIERFEAISNHIISEIKAYGARSHYQLVQNYWLSVIDKDYGAKLMSHLSALSSIVIEIIGLKTEDGTFIPGMIDKTFGLYDQAGSEVNYADQKPILIPYPPISPLAASHLAQIIKQYYIAPLAAIAQELQSEPLLSQLPQGKSWWLKYPVMVAKIGIRGSKYIVNKIADQALVPVALAFAGTLATLLTGGLALPVALPLAVGVAGTTLTGYLSYSGIAFVVIGFDPKASWDQLGNAQNWTNLAGLVESGYVIRDIKDAALYKSSEFIGKLQRLGRE